MYTNYAYGVQNQTGTSSANYNLFVTGTNDYTGSTGVMIKNDTTLSGPNKKGTRIFQDSNDNAFLDFRTTATDGAKSLAFRLQDDASPSTFNNMLTLNKDTVSDTSVYGASVAGRIKASQFFSNQPDTRAPTTAGVYMGHNNATTGYFNINKGTGSGGFNFQTFNADGVTNKTNLSLNGSGSVQIPYYSTVTTDSQDSETTAMAVFDATGNLVRSYQQNQRFRSVETRLNTLEGEVVASVPIKVNEIIGRLNTLKIWNTKINDLSISAPPAPFNPSPDTSTAAVQVQLALSVDLITAQDPVWQQTFINAVATNLGISSSRIVISSVSLTATVFNATYKHITVQKAYTAAAAGSIFVTLGINPGNGITPSLAANLIIAGAQDINSGFSNAMKDAGAVLDRGYVPVQKPSATVTPAPTLPPLDPTTIPGLLLWLDANDLTTFSPANITNNTDITQWRDKSGNQNHCTPTIFATSPVMNNPKYNETGQSGKKSVYLNRSKFIGNFSTAYKGQSVIVFMVMKATNTGGDSVGRLISLGTLGQTDFQDISATHISGAGAGSSYGFNSLRSTPSWTPSRSSGFTSPNCLNVSTLVELIDNPTEHTMQINGGTTSNSSAGLPNNFNFVNYTIGGDLIAQDVFLSGYLSEVLVFGNTLTTDQKQKVEGYLAYKWGLRSSLATNHPYRTTLPANETIMTGQKIRFYTDNTSFPLSSAGIEVYSYPGGPNIINSGLSVSSKSNYSAFYGTSNWLDNSQTAWIALAESGQYVEVNLGSMVPIYKIVLYSRMDCCGQANNGGRIQIKDGNNTQLYLSNVLKDPSGSTTPSFGDASFNNWVFYPSNPDWNGYSIANILNVPTVTITSTGTTTVDLAITAPNVGGTAITSYKVYINGSSTSSGSTSTNSYQATGLNVNTPYSFTVSAVSSGGESQKSSAVSTTTLSTVPSKPTITTSVISPSQINLTITPASDGGSAITSYKVYINGNSTSAGSTSTTSYSSTGLTANTSYSFTVSAVNSIGEGAKSDAVSASTLANPSSVTYTTTSTFTIPNNNRMDVTVIGGGGGGQGGYGPYTTNMTGNDSGGGGGTSGGITYRTGIVLSGGTITVTPGAGGTGGAGRSTVVAAGTVGLAGSNGGQSSVTYSSTTINAPGGIGAVINTGTSAPTNANTGAQTTTGTGNSSGYWGGASGSGISFSMANVGTITYAGGGGGDFGSPGSNGDYGSGGGGGNAAMKDYGRYSKAGGNGGGGVIIIRYYNV